MGCNCLTTSISIYEDELCIELATTHQDLLSENIKLIKSCRSNMDKKVFYLKSKQNNKEFEKKEKSKNNKKSYTLNKMNKNNEVFTPKKFVTRLSVEKLNKLFDDSNIENYNNSKSFKNFSFGVNSYIFNFSSRNNISTTLNSTFEQTFHNTIKKDNLKNVNKRTNK